MRRALPLIVGVLGVVLAAGGFEFGDSWPYHLGQITGWLGTAGTLWALWLQHREVRPFEYHFTESSWKPHGSDEFRLEIARSKHGKGRSPSVVVYGRDEATGGYQEVFCGIEVEPSGTVRILVTNHSRLSGKAVIGEARECRSVASGVFSGVRGRVILRSSYRRSSRKFSGSSVGFL